MGVLVLLVTMWGAKSREMSRNGSTVVETPLKAIVKVSLFNLD